MYFGPSDQIPETTKNAIFAMKTPLFQHIGVDPIYCDCGIQERARAAKRSASPSTSSLRAVYLHPRRLTQKKEILFALQIERYYRKSS